MAATSATDGGRRRPTVVFDGGILAAGPDASPGVAQSFATTLRAYADRDDANCVLYVPAGAPIAAEDLRGVRILPGPAAGRWRRQRAFPRWLREVAADLLHAPVAAVPLRAPCPVIATVHDLPWLAPEHLHEAACGPWHRLAVRLAARRAAAIVTPTAATAADLGRYLGGRGAAPVHVIPHGVTAARHPAGEGDGPLLVVGDARPRKNLDRVRRAWARAHAEAPDLPPLRFVGPGFDYLSRPDLEALLGQADALIHLAVHEGFGLPVAEAMAAGTPVLCSDIPSLREVAGADAALRVSPFDVPAMARAMIRIHRDHDLRRRLRAAGRARAAQLTPAASAAGWATLHRDLLRRHTAVAEG